MIYRLFYVSSSSGSMTPAVIQGIVEKAVRYNTKNGITGTLLYRAGIFLQLLEGDEKTVRDLFENKIKNDPRHDHIVEFFGKDGEKRLFPNWAMSHKEISDLDVRMVNEILSWNKLIDKARGEINDDLILEMLGRFKNQVM